MRIIYVLFSLALSAKFAASSVDGTGMFYVNPDDWKSCVRDCEPGGPLDSVSTSRCGGIITESRSLHHDVDDCCSVKLSWMDVDLCKDNSNPSSDGTNKWWADGLDGTCHKDCDESYNSECKRVPPPVVLHDSISTCCSDSLSWVDQKFCNSRAVQGKTGGWVIDWENEKCTQDCEGGAPCAHHNEPTEKIFQTNEECCSRLTWVSSASCLGSSLNVPTFTNKWYVDWSTHTCAKDCDPALGSPCKGNIEPYVHKDLFPTVEACCNARLSWAPTPSCVSVSGGGGHYPTVPTPTIVHPTPTPLPTPAIVHPTPTPLPTPTIVHPTPTPLTCQTDSHCHAVCMGATYNTVGTCQLAQSTTLAPSQPPTDTLAAPSQSPASCTCTNPKSVPNKCELKFLIDELELAFRVNPRLAAQSIRASFHDAGTFDLRTDVGGANGCLMNEPNMRLEPENNGLDLPLNNLQDIKKFWLDHPATCIDISSSDILQFAAFFAVVRQMGVPGLTPAKREVLTGNASTFGNVSFKWGRPDAQICDTLWTDNLPGFSPEPGTGVANRCTAAGGEIKDKMMDRNGFTAKEATTLIGAHTIGVVRHTFGSSYAFPWVVNGEDSATGLGPVFDNSYHDFLINTVTATTLTDFAASPLGPPPTSRAPFTMDFPNWFFEGANVLTHLDSDLALAFPSLDTAKHPSFDTFSTEFANDNDEFLKMFFLSLDKMSKLGVEEILNPPGDCDGCTPSSITSTVRDRALMHVDKRRLQVNETIDDPGTLTAEDSFYLVRKFGDGAARADARLRRRTFERRDEIRVFTTPVGTIAPTPGPSSDPLDSMSTTQDLGFRSLSSVNKRLSGE